MITINQDTPTLIIYAAQDSDKEDICVLAGPTDESGNVCALLIASDSLKTMIGICEDLLSAIDDQKAIFEDKLRQQTVKDQEPA